MKKFTSLFILALFNVLSLEAQESNNFILEVKKIRTELSGGISTKDPDTELELLNVSYDPTREFYNDINEKFEKWWKEKTGQEIEIRQSHGGSSTQARAVIFGLEADVVTLALSYDIDAIQQKTQWLPNGWEKRLPNNSVPFTSTVVFLVKKGNPKNIRDWDDLIRENISVITPNPKTSGGARWNYLAAWGYAISKHQGDERRALLFMQKLFHNVPVLDTGARAAATTFVKRGMGDVLITWENEAYLAAEEFGKGKFEIVYPSISVNASLPVAWVDHVIDLKETRNAAEHYLKFLYTEEAQEIGARHYFRPIDPIVLAKHVKNFKKIKTLSIDQFGGWNEVQKKHFADNAIFDEIYSLKE